MITAATVGFGDIAPKSGFARGMVCVEVIFNLVFVIFIFAVIASGVRAVAENKKESK